MPTKAGLADTGYLSVHVLDTATGQPAAGLSLTLFRIVAALRTPLGTFVTNEDGRCDAPLLAGAAFTAGIYEVVFHVAAWRAAAADPGFYDLIPIRFVVTDPAVHIHIPLLLSPFGYTTYRGS
jgi:5-hydroxyisourate hydrolase